MEERLRRVRTEDLPPDHRALMSVATNEPTMAGGEPYRRGFARVTPSDLVGLFAPPLVSRYVRHPGSGFLADPRGLVPVPARDEVLAERRRQSELGDHGRELLDRAVVRADAKVDVTPGLAPARGSGGVRLLDHVRREVARQSHEGRAAAADSGEEAEAEGDLDRSRASSARVLGALPSPTALPWADDVQFGTQNRHVPGTPFSRAELVLLARGVAVVLDATRPGFRRPSADPFSAAEEDEVTLERSLAGLPLGNPDGSDPLWARVLPWDAVSVALQSRFTARECQAAALRDLLPLLRRRWVVDGDPAECAFVSPDRTEPFPDSWDAPRPRLLDQPRRRPALHSMTGFSTQPPWSPATDAALRSLVARWGPKGAWGRIAASLPPALGPTALECLRRWIALERRATGARERRSDTSTTSRAGRAGASAPGSRPVGAGEGREERVGARFSDVEDARLQALAIVFRRRHGGGKGGSSEGGRGGAMEVKRGGRGGRRRSGGKGGGRDGAEVGGADEGDEQDEEEEEGEGDEEDKESDIEDEIEEGDRADEGGGDEGEGHESDDRGDEDDGGAESEGGRRPCTRSSPRIPWTRIEPLFPTRAAKQLRERYGTTTTGSLGGSRAE